MNRNQVVTDAFSSPDAKRLYKERWPEEPELREKAEGECLQCGGCSFYAKFNSDWGLCSNADSRHHLETVFEHFTCGAHVNEGWAPHSFTEFEEFQCKCGGGPPPEVCSAVLSHCASCTGSDADDVLRQISEFLLQGDRLSRLVACTVGEPKHHVWKHLLELSEDRGNVEQTDGGGQGHAVGPSD